MSDMTQTIIPKSDQMNADDLMGGRTVTIKITKVTIVSGDQPVSLHYEGDNGKPYKPGKSMRRVLVQVWGKDANVYIGRSLTLFCDPKVSFGGTAVGGIRISHMSHITESVTMALTATRAQRKPFTVKPLPTAAALTIDPEVKEKGHAAASLGVESYKEWLATLTTAVKATVKPYHTEWSELAKKRDADFEPTLDDSPVDDSQGDPEPE